MTCYVGKPHHPLILHLDRTCAVMTRSWPLYQIALTQHWEQIMNLILIFELVGLPGLIWLIVLFKKSGELTERRFALLVVAYLSLITVTLFQTYARTPVLRYAGDFLSLLILFPGYLIVRYMYRWRMFVCVHPSLFHACLAAKRQIQ